MNELEYNYHGPLVRRVLDKIYSEGLVNRNLSGPIVTEEEFRGILSDMEFMKTDTVAKSKLATGYLEAFRSGPFADMHDNLDARKNGLDHEAITIFSAFEAILQPGVRITQEDLDNYYPAYRLLNEKMKAMANLLEKVANDPHAYYAKYDQPELWEQFLDMFLVTVPEKAAKGAKKAGWELAMGILPFAAIGLFGLWLFTKIKK